MRSRLTRVRAVVAAAGAFAVLATGSTAMATEAAYRVLTPGVQQTHAAPVPEGDEYQISQGCCTGYWGTVAVRAPNSDNDLNMYGDEARTTFLGSSKIRGEIIDFVSDYLGGETHYPVVTRKSGRGNYTVEYAQDSYLGSGVSKILQTIKSDIVWSYTVPLTAGTTTTISADPSGNKQDMSIFIMQNTGTDVRPRILRVAEATGARPGHTQTLEFTAPVSTDYGVVILQEAGQGVLTISRDLP